MPTLSEFFGIFISIRTRETPHPRPHFHAWYSGEEVSVAIDTLEILAGSIQHRALGLVMEWAFAHRAQLLAA